jgi:hypothetical protein
MRRIVFGASEYCKDGINPLNEVLGPGPWTARQYELLDAIFEHASVVTAYGLLPADDSEVNGELIQALVRAYAMSRRTRYLAWAERIADAYIYEVLPRCGGLPTSRWDFRAHRAIDDELILNDHGGEIVGGLSEAYVAVAAWDRGRAKRYREPLLGMCRRLLQNGRNADGLWYNTLQASTGRPTNRGTPDAWGYAMSGMVTIGMVAGEPDAVDAGRRALRGLANPRYRSWKGADSYADAIESCLLLLQLFPEPAAQRWLDRVLPTFLALQRCDGIVEGWYGDGNYARTALMAALYCTQGSYCLPWRRDVRLGALRSGNGLTVVLAVDHDWDGTVLFDVPRHREYMRLPLNYPRLNGFPEWFVVEPACSYRVTVDGGPSSVVSGAVLAGGLAIRAAPGAPVVVEVQPSREAAP